MLTLANDLTDSSYARSVYNYVDLNVHMNLFQGDSDQRFVTRIWLDYEKQNECE